MSSGKKGLAPLAVCSVFMLCFSCASAPSKTGKGTLESPEAFIQQVESSGQVSSMNEKILKGGTSSRPSSLNDYRIGPDDLLEISVFEEEKLNKTVRVSSQGNVSLPLVGVLKVKGMTARELEKEIEDLLAEKYLKNPQVSIFIKDYRNQRISVMGAVVKPGVIDVTGQKAILDLLSLAGGLREDAGQLLFLIRPPNQEQGEAPKKDASEEKKPKTYIIDLEELLMKGDLKSNLVLLHGDVVNVPIRGKMFVGGEVRKQGGFPLSRRMTVSQAIALAEGLTSDAGGSQVKVFRYSGKGSERKVFIVNVYAIQKGKEEDPQVKENDVIMVPRNDGKAIAREVWDFLKGRVGAFTIGAAM